jgi:hypothetical protein
VRTTKSADAGAVRIGADDAVDIATEFLIMHVGDLLAAGVPRLGTHGFWVVPILVGNAAQGMLGEVGTLQVSAEDGTVVFSEADRAEVEARAEQLVTVS